MEFIKGQSVSITIAFNAEYDYNNIQDIVVVINNDTVAKLSDDTLLTTANPRAFRVQLSSNDTLGLREISFIQVFLDDSVLGVRPFEQQQIRAVKQLTFGNASVNTGSDFTLNLTVNEEGVDIDLETITIYNTLSGALLQSNNLSDLTSASSARTNLGLGTLATQSGTFSGTHSGASSGTNTGDQDLSSLAPKESPTFTGTVSGITKSMVGLGNVDNTSDANKPVSAATQTALDLKATLQISATYAAIGASTEKRFVQVTTDETNGNETTLYYHNGTILNWVITQQV